MWWLKRKQLERADGQSVPEQEMDAKRRMLFHAALDTIDCLALGKETGIEKAAVYDFAIWALGRQIAADGCGLLVSKKNVPDSRDYDISLLGGGVKCTELGERDMDIAEVPTYTGMWDYTKFLEAYRSVLEKGFCDELKNARGIYYSELNFATILSGRHHTSWAVYMGSCVLPMRVVSIKPYFPMVETDGAYFTFQNNEGRAQKVRIADARFAVMYALAQKKWKMGCPEKQREELFNTRKNLNARLEENLRMAKDASVERVFRTLQADIDSLGAKTEILRLEVERQKTLLQQKDARIQDLEQRRAAIDKIQEP